MLVKDIGIAQVTFGSMGEWSPNHKIAIGEFLIACSQWEYVYELLWKDLHPSDNVFLDRMKDADRKILNKDSLKNALVCKGSAQCLEIKMLIEYLESKYRGNRDTMVHGFYHVYEGNALISHITNRKDDIIGEELNSNSLSNNANDINDIVNKINSLRRKEFHPDQRIVAVSAAVVQR